MSSVVGTSAPGKHTHSFTAVATESMLAEVESMRQDASLNLDAETRLEFGQFLTPIAVGRLLASMFDKVPDEIRLLDAGAGVGSLTAAYVSEVLNRVCRPRRISVTAFEIDEGLVDQLRLTLELCSEACSEAGVDFDCELRNEDFVASGVQAVRRRTFRFNAAILNPPYFKLAAHSGTRALLREVGAEVPNMYAAFVALTLELLDKDGEMVAITPRSFCNGTYFKRFREFLLDRMQLRRLHVFESRSESFGDAGVLQENLIVHGVRGRLNGDKPVVLSTTGHYPRSQIDHTVRFDQIVMSGDPERFIHADIQERDGEVTQAMLSLPGTLSDMGLTVSTGPVVDFRCRPSLRPMPSSGTVPLIYPNHFTGRVIEWPKEACRKPNALASDDSTRSLLVPDGNYVLVKRFTSKEERRRIVAAVYWESQAKSDLLGFENHLNYIHVQGGGLAPAVALGLAIFLNSSSVDTFFRRFSGHTQVNAGDLRNMRFPALHGLIDVGSRASACDLDSQERIDELASSYFLLR